jgi:hypothetical protein
MANYIRLNPNYNIKSGINAGGSHQEEQTPVVILVVMNLDHFDLE